METLPTLVQISIVGCQYRVKACQSMMSDEEWYRGVHLELDPDNQVDSNAIKLMYYDQHIGFVSSEDIVNVRDQLVHKMIPTAWRIVSTKFDDLEKQVLRWVVLEVEF